ncbi:MAG: DUF2135 domain-containing protein [Crocinitomicaceae bacterium]|nr:DUF2135 domain-containing protein [Crocinitomicaceae bacterium]
MQKKYLLLSSFILLLSSLLFGTYSFTSNDKKTVSIKTHFNSSLFQFPSINDSIKSFPAVMIKDEKGVSSPIKMEALNVNVKVVGNISTTTLEMLFYNDSSRVLEGELYFPLNEGQSVSRFALDINGKLREGVIVEKNKGQKVFESVIRQKVDPGLLEWTVGNNFKARIYPIPAKGHKRMVVAYEEELQASQNAFIYQLPLNFKQRVKKFDLKVEVVNQEIKPALENHELANLKFKKWNENYVAEISKENYLPQGNLGVALPIPKNRKQIYTEKIPGTNNSYYYYAIVPVVGGNPIVENLNTISLVWDASSSSVNRNIQREFALLEQFFNTNSSVKVQLYTLRNDLKKEKTYTVNGGNWPELKTVLSSITYDGASAYRAIDYSQFKSEAVLVFGDGISNFGRPIDFKANCPIYTITSSLSSNHSYLKSLSSNTGGASINLTTQTLEESLSLLTTSKFHYFGNAMTKSYPSIPTAVYDKISVVGIISGKTNVSFDFGYDQVSNSIKYEIDPEKHISETGLIRRIWAQKKLAELDINFEQNKNEITRLGKQFGIVTRTTSLIVLDRIEDYVEHEITPPKELVKKYETLLAAKKSKQVIKDQNHLTKVKSDFNAYVTWWKTDFDIDKILLEDKKRVLLSDSIRTLNGRNSIHNLNLEPVMEDVEDAQSALAIESEADESMSANRLEPVEENIKQLKASRHNRNKGKIELEKWEPNAAYIKPLKLATKDKLYSEYLKLKETYVNSPSYYLDVADLLIEQNNKDLALRVLSNIAELELENHELLRVLAHRLEQLDYLDLAISNYKDVLKLRAEEPQSYRDLALCLDRNGEHQEAIELLNNVVNGAWDTRFPGIQTIALTEINRIISQHKNQVNTAFISDEFIQATPVDVRVIINWDSDNCDMDLWVTDPRKEKCFYSNRNTEIGGRISNDFTGGYGPEIFDIKKAMKGNYKVQINYYGTRSQKTNMPTTIQVQLITNYGKSNESVKEVTRRLSNAKEVIDIGNLIFE